MSQDTLTQIDLGLLESTLATMPPEMTSDHLSTEHCTVANALHAILGPLAFGQAMYCGYEETKIKKIVVPGEPILRTIRHSPGVERFIRETDGAVNDGDHSRNYTAAEAIAIIGAIKERGYA